MPDEKATVIMERMYTFPIGKIYFGRRSNRAARAARRLRLFVKRHTKADRVVITNDVNNKIWGKGIEKPPRKIRILVKLFEEGEEEKEKVAVVFLA